MTIEIESVIRRNADILETRVDEEVILMHPASGAIFSLKTTSIAIWEALDGVRTVDQVIDAMAAEYAVARAVCAPEVIAFLDQLAAKDLIARA